LISDKPASEEGFIFRGGIFTVAVALGFLFLGNVNRGYLSENSLSNPVIISHRGVSQNNGVQNTIPSLIKTSKLALAYTAS
jgi:glycerophosphoryl diester phosphodiesterase